ncbi:MAG: hypothetical protein KIT31_13825 [Deltaproteobacteria bacterium]|nr:hypothetical protein [Deltaproteobacteria bacterium]
MALIAAERSGHGCDTSTMGWSSGSTARGRRGGGCARRRTARVAAGRKARKEAERWQAALAEERARLEHVVAAAREVAAKVPEIGRLASRTLDRA